MTPITILGIRGRNGADSPLMLADDQCVDAVNVDFAEGGLMRRRGGSAAIGVTFASGGPFAANIPSLIRHVPDADLTAMELWAADSSNQIARLAGGTTWTEPTLAVSPSGTAYNNVIGVSLAGKLWLYYASAENRAFVWDGSTVRRRGLALPAAPTVATLGGAGLTFTRYYRVLYVVVSGTTVVRRSQPSASATLAITDDTGIRVTKPAAANEGETHWEVEYSDDDVTFYFAARTAVGTTTYDDTDATIDTTAAVTDDAANLPTPCFKYGVAAGARLLQAGAYLTSSSAGSTFIPLANEVYWTPINGATDVGDLERQPIAYRVSLDHPVIGLSEAINGVHYAFGPTAYSALISTNLPGEGAFQRITESMSVGCIRHQTIVSAVDELGRPAVYFLSQQGPCRIGVQGLQYLGTDIEDLWDGVNLSTATIAGHGVYYADRRQVWFWVTETSQGAGAAPTLGLIFDTRLGRSEGALVRGGWSTQTTLAYGSWASAMFSTSIAASMGVREKPVTSGSTIVRWDTGTDDNGTDFQAYLDTKEYAPAGIGTNCSVTEGFLVGEASPTALATVTLRTDFGRRDTVQETVILAPEQTETHVQVTLATLRASGIGTFRVRIGDAAVADPGFGTLDAVVLHVEPVERR